jgi:GTPase SAR1 family protein
MESKIIIVGPGGSGKDFLRKKFTDKGFTYGVSFTSRPPREGEEEGIDYFFRDAEFFENNREISIHTIRSFISSPTSSLIKLHLNVYIYSCHVN